MCFSGAYPHAFRALDRPPPGGRVSLSLWLPNPDPYASYHNPVIYTSRLDKSLSTLYIACCPGNNVRATKGAKHGNQEPS